MTAPMTRAKALSHPPDKLIFPTPPQKHADVQFRLCRNLVLAPREFRWTADEVVACFFGAGTAADTRDADVDVELAEKEWHPEPEPEPEEGGRGGGGKGGEVGRWLQRASFASQFTLNVSPTFSAPTVTVNVRTLSTPRFDGPR